MIITFHHHHHDFCSSTFMFRASSISSSAAPAPRFCNACISSYSWPICWSTNNENQYSSFILPCSTHTAHLLQLLLVYLSFFPAILLEHLCIQLPLCEEADLWRVVSVLELLLTPARGECVHTICIGFSTFLCALNSLLIYISPSIRSSGASLRCALKSLLYSGIGGSNASGAGFRGLLRPSDAGLA